MTAIDKPVALETRKKAEDGRRYSPSSARNCAPISDVLLSLGLTQGRVLEVASGTGEHGVHMTKKFHDFIWTYTDIDIPSLRSQAAWKAVSEHSRLRGPLNLDASHSNWGSIESGPGWDIIYNANMIHISPFEATRGLLAGAGRLLGRDGILFLYGPFSRAGEIAPSNAAFSESLQQRNPQWGVRDLEHDILPLAEAAGLSLASVNEMPANNLCVVFRRV